MLYMTYFLWGLIPFLLVFGVVFNHRMQDVWIFLSAFQLLAHTAI